jgi:hypothetical protein
MAKGSHSGKRVNLLSKGQFLNVAWKAAHWYKNYRLVEISYDTATLYLKVESHSNPGTFHEQRILLRSIADQLYYNKVAERTFNPDKSRRNFSTHADKAFLKSNKPIKEKDLGKFLEDTPLKVSCSCPMFWYWGFAYIAWKKGYGLMRCNYVPHVRNPYQQGSVCNHLHFILAYVYPKILPSVERLLIRKGLLDYRKPPTDLNSQ